jgi:multidrug efflux system outer membrane protein
MKYSSQILKTFSLALLPLVISACSTYKSVDAVRSTINLPVTPAAFVLPQAATDQQPVAAWWAQLNDEQLNSLINSALTQNHSIRIAQASLNESRALLRNSKLARFPQIEADVSGARQKQSADTIGSNQGRISESYQAGFEASWELDLFGRVNNGVKLSRAQEAAREADLQAVQVSVSAEVVNAYILLRGNQYLLNVAQQNATNQRETLTLIHRFADVGRSDQLDIARAESQLELTLAALPEFEAQINIALNRIGVLTGKPTTGLKQQLAVNKSLPSIPATFAVGNPLDLLKRRPDIRHAEQALAGAVAEYNIRVADLYPSITFTGGLGYLSADWTRLGDTNTDTFNFTPHIHWAAFNLARVNAQVDAADARTQARVAEFEQQVLVVLEETDNTLQNYAHEEERRTRLQKAAQASYQAADFARRKFEIGSSDFLTVLDAQRSQLTVSAQLAQSDMQLLLNLVAVYKSLGGGWQFDPSSQLMSQR